MSHTIKRPHDDCRGKGCARCDRGTVTLQRTAIHERCDDYAESLETELKMAREQNDDLRARLLGQCTGHQAEIDRLTSELLQSQESARIKKMREAFRAKLTIEKRHIRELQDELRQVRSLSQGLIAACVVNFSAAKN